MEESSDVEKFMQHSHFKASSERPIVQVRFTVLYNEVPSLYGGGGAVLKGFN